MAKSAQKEKKTTTKRVASPIGKTSAKKAAPAKTRSVKAKKAAPKTSLKKAIQNTMNRAMAATTQAFKDVVNKTTSKAGPAKKKVTAKVTTAAFPLMFKTLPEFELPGTGNQVFRLSEAKGKNVVLYFYPKDATPGCTIEGHEFTKLNEKFKETETVVYGVSRDSLKSHENFKEKQCYTLDLLSDTDEVACKMFDVIKEKNMYGKKVIGIERSTFVIDKNGQLIKEWRKVKVDGHAQEVLSFIQSLEG